VRRLDAFEDRRRQAWERVHELEERSAPAGALSDVERQKELLEAHDFEGLTRLFERTHAEHESAVVEAPRARRRAMVRFELPVALTGLAILAAVPAINALWLSALDVDYFGTYLEDGFAISLLFGVVAAAVALDSQPNLIAAHPLAYLGGVSQLLSTVSAGVTNLFERPLSERALAEAGLPYFGSRFRLRGFDLALSVLFGLVFAAGMVAWALLIAPLQYWVNLVSGAPAREALASSKTLWMVSSPKQTELLFASKNPNEFEREELREAHERGEMTEIAFAKHPVTFTSAVAAAVLFGVSRLV
jgi:hypothetical protein